MAKRKRSAKTYTEGLTTIAEPTEYAIDDPRSAPAFADLTLDAPYDVLAVPLGVLNWNSPGKLWDTSRMGARDQESRRQFEALHAAGYSIVNFTIFNQLAYFLFRKDPRA